MGIGAATIKPKSEPDQSPKPIGYLYNVSPGALFPEEHAVSSARLSERYVAPCGGLALRLIARHACISGSADGGNRAAVQPFSLRLPKTGGAPAEAVKFRRAGGILRHDTAYEGDPVMKTIFTAASLGLLMALPVAAQEATAPSGHSAPVIESVERQTAVSFSGEVSAKELLDAAVVNSANEIVGDVNDVLIDHDGKVAAVIVGVGGFLGMGEKDVALAYDQLTFAKDLDSKLVVGTNATKESLETAPEYIAPAEPK
jgi:hypothetical protein